MLRQSRFIVLPFCLSLLVGCHEPPVLASRKSEVAEQKSSVQTAQRADVFTVQNGDTLRFSFPGSPNLDTSQQIRPDGRITMPIIGEVVAAGKTPVALEKELVTLYSPHLVSKEVTVTVVSASFSIFVSGAVQKPGKITTDRPITVLEAIMESGGFDTAKANTAAVAVIRQNGNKTEHFTLNLKQVLEGKQVEAFYLRRSDIVHVPEKFTWF
ncbi:MAG: polysaccharide biosynthesis/export family protein [Verrucomicrobia bacterium]|nr:polysaccharide biosynthesis/export family protein [Verrucomicrobiota bacterium]